LHVLGRAAIDAVRVAVAPDVRWQDRLMPRVDAVAHGLAHEVRADLVALQIVAIQEVALRAAVVGIGDGLIDFKVVAPAGELDTLITKIAGLAAHIFERQIGPLAGEQRDGTGHGWTPKLVCEFVVRREARAASREINCLKLLSLLTPRHSRLNAILALCD